MSDRRACAALGQHRSTQRKVPQGRDDEARLTADIVELASQYGRYGYRKIAALLRHAGWLVSYVDQNQSGSRRQVLDLRYVQEAIRQASRDQ